MANHLTLIIVTTNHISYGYVFLSHCDIVNNNIRGYKICNWLTFWRHNLTFYI